MALNKAKTINRPDGTTVTGSYWKITKDSGSQNLGTVYNFTASVTKAQLAGDVTALGYTTIMSQIAEPAPKFFSITNTPKQAWVDLAGATNN